MFFDKLYDFAKSDYNSLNNGGKLLPKKEWDQLVARKEKEIEKLEKQAQEHADKIEKGQKEKDELNFWITTHEQAAGEIDAPLLQKLEKKMAKLEKDLEEAKDIQAENQKSLTEAREGKGEAQKIIKSLNVKKLAADFRTMKEVEKTLAGLGKDLQLQKSILENQQEDIDNLKKAPCESKYPNCYFIKDGHKAKKEVGKQQQKIDSLLERIESNEKFLKDFTEQEIEEKLNEHNEKISEINSLETEIAGLSAQTKLDTQKVRQLEGTLKDCQSEYQSSIQTVDQLTSKEFVAKTKKLKETNKRIEQASKKKEQLLFQIGAKNEALQKLREERRENKNLIAKLKLFDSIQSAFSKYGIPAMVLKSQLPAINKEVARLLENLDDFDVTLETDIASNVMDIYIQDGKGKRLVELGSGMEKTFCSLVLRVALGNLSSLPRPDIFVLDEPFGFLDEESLQMAIDLISVLEESFKTVLIITHSAPIKEIANNIIEIKTNDIESSVVLS